MDETVHTPNRTFIDGLTKIPTVHLELNSQVAHMPQKVTQVPRPQPTRPLELRWRVILKVTKNQSA
jgi:hypothetical protein